MVPFEVYSLSVLVFAIEKATNKSVPIVIVSAGQAPDNFHVSCIGMGTTATYTYDSGTGPTTIGVDSQTVYIQVKRSRSAQALTMCLFLANWALTTGSIYIVFVVIFGGEEINEAVLLLPITVILTIPAPRSLYPGSPPFGIFIGNCLGQSDISSSADAPSRYIRLRLADDDSHGVRHHPDVLSCYSEVLAETTSLPRR